jgi:hypothetical protein
VLSRHSAMRPEPGREAAENSTLASKEGAIDSATGLISRYAANLGPSRYRSIGRRAWWYTRMTSNTSTRLR